MSVVDERICGYFGEDRKVQEMNGGEEVKKWVVGGVEVELYLMVFFSMGRHTSLRIILPYA